MIIEVPKYRLRPPLRKPDPVADANSSRGSIGAASQGRVIHQDTTAAVEPEVGIAPQAASMQIGFRFACTEGDAHRSCDASF
jgi:hypothetical protein